LSSHSVLTHFFLKKIRKKDKKRKCLGPVDPWMAGGKELKKGKRKLKAAMRSRL
jgi:hypothetical protein